jgi:hypothetical protein
MASVYQLLTIGISSTIQDRSVDLSSPRSCIPPNPGHDLAQSSRPIAAHRDGYRP